MLPQHQTARYYVEFVFLSEKSSNTGLECKLAVTGIIGAVSFFFFSVLLPSSHGINVSDAASTSFTGFLK